MSSPLTPGGGAWTTGSRERRIAMSYLHVLLWEQSPDVILGIGILLGSGYMVAGYVLASFVARWSRARGRR